MRRQRGSTRVGGGLAGGGGGGARKRRYFLVARFTTSKYRRESERVQSFEEFSSLNRWKIDGDADESVPVSIFLLSARSFLR